MLELVNKTLFPAALLPTLDKNGDEHLTVIVKGTFAIQKGEAQPAEEQPGLVAGDKHHGDPASSSLRYESDLGPLKPGTDVALVGSAWSPRPVKALDVGLAVGPVRKVFRVFGERVWYRGVVGHQKTEPREFTEMPLVYERAFGGWDRSHPDEKKHAYEARNPVGTGFSTGKSAEQLENLRLPNLEDPRELIASPTDRPAPVGVGFVGRGWMPRARLAGTYDEHWQKERCPLLPLDFDDAFHNGASPGLTARPYLKGGEQVALIHVSPRQKELTFQLPTRTLGIRAFLKGQPHELTPVLDTVLLEPDLDRVSLTWRAALRCTRQLLHVERVTVREL